MRIKLLGRIGCLGGVAAVCAVASLAAGAPVASASEACSSITGSGSSLQNLAQKNVWSKTWSSLWNLMPVAISGETTLECSEMASVTYEPTSSGKGEAEWGAGSGTLKPAESANGSTLDEFIGTDVGPEGTATTGQIGEMDKAGKTSIITIPVAQSAISVIVSLPEGCTPGAGTASVKNMGLWEEWDTNKTSFTNLIGGVTLTGASCSEEPMLEARETASGTTAGFKRYLDDLEPTAFDSCTLTAVNSESPSCWPIAPVETGNNTGGKLTEKVYETPKTIGYADLADARTKFAKPGTPEEHAVGGKKFYSIILEVPNEGASLPEGGHIVSPEGTNEESNCSKAKYEEPTTVAPNINWSVAKETNAVAGETNVYPICTLTFDVAWEHYEAVGSYTHAQYSTAFNYLRSVVTEGQTGTALTELEKAHFFGVPSKVKTEDEAGVKMSNIFWSAKGS